MESQWCEDAGLQTANLTIDLCNRYSWFACGDKLIVFLHLQPGKGLNRDR